ncbi:hypothetical protein K0B96_14835 [Horticoccus luteus]|uniref:TonB-dependent receptor plug domain-containing protein n=1 Tax=Horticoccus luteus TaxID=2862869 RepID=A0A8F9TVJ1_9BACT|nr:TonB-dependent receptor plug domain-containing protein [Horticoccus luteus]QYM78559.1 hypothetical protein K0B96_14835 [Horticoccus luteus]
MTPSPAVSVSPVRLFRWPTGRFILIPALLAIAAVAQGAPSTATPPSAADLAKYDTNKNGRLDADELAAKKADDDRAVRQAVLTNPEAAGHATREPVQQMDPFTVKEEKDGYYGSNAMSGTRLNSKVEDLASSVTVVTLDQMDDFAMLDINDIFSYEAGTEGLNEYTDFTVETSGNINDNSSTSPGSANRIRGIGSANIALGNFETAGRVPIDKVGIEGVEISRGPNSSIFGLGSPAGTVNVVAATGNLNKDKTKIEFRADSFGGYRESFDTNKVILKNKLAVRVSQVFMHTGYHLKPSGTNTERYNFMVKYQPFKGTVVTASYLDYRYSGIRANTLTPRDGTQDWKAAGMPTWDPVTNTAYNADGSVRYTNAAGKLPSYFTTLYQNTGRGNSLLFLDGGGVDYWTTPRGTATPTNGKPMSPLGIPIPLGPFDNNPATWDNNAKTSQAAYNYVVPSFGAGNAGLIKGAPPLTDYDWRNVNLASINKEWNRTGQSLIQLTQTILDTPMNLVALQAGWFRETSKLTQDTPYGKPYGYYLIDVNRRRMDGSENPNLGRPFISIPDASLRETPLTNNTYRAQLAYKLDLRREKGWWHWLGMHQLSAFQEYKHYETRRYVYKPAMLDDHVWLPYGVNRATSSGVTTNYGSELYNKNSPVGSRNYYMYYVGDNQDYNIDYAPRSFSPGVYDFTYGDAKTGNFYHEPTQLGFAGSLDGTGGANNDLKIQKTSGVVLQSHLIRDSIVPTFGFRRDNIYDRSGVLPKMKTDGLSHDYAWDEQWNSDWVTNQGSTTTKGVVVRPLPWLSGTKAGAWLSSLTWFNGISFYGNKSDSFLPDVPAIDLHGNRVPNPTGLGKDYGVWVNLFDSKFNIRVNKYENRTIGNRRGTSSTIANRLLAIDIYDGTASRAFALQNRASQWIVAQNPSITVDQLRQQVASVMHLSPDFIDQMSRLDEEGLNLAEPEDTLARGTEIEFNYNPTRFWTMKGNVTQQESIQAKIASGLLNYINERMPVWESVVDPAPPATIDNPTGAPTNWYTYQYDGPNVGSAKIYYDGKNVSQPLAIAIAQEGLSMPQIRRYSARFLTNYRLEGITDNPVWKAVSIGGAVRWQDKGAIGYWGIKDSTGVYTQLDKSRPIYDESHLAFDLTLGYQMKLFAGRRINARFQLNVKNVQEDGRLQPLAAWPDGTISAYRVVDPRMFLLTASFDL